MAKLDETLDAIADKAAEQATERSQRGDVEGSFYSRGLRDAYRTAALMVRQEPGS